MEDLSAAPAASAEHLERKQQTQRHWIRHQLLQGLQGAKDSIGRLGLRLQDLIHGSGFTPSPREIQPVAPPSSSVEDSTKRQLEAWKKNLDWTDKPPVLQVQVPKGTLCKLESVFQIGLPPDALFDIITDPANKRVFRNIKEVTYRKVLEDEGNRQLVEVEQVAIWKFLCFSGTMSIRLFVDQNRDDYSLNYCLSREGFMKKFEGSWDIKPIYVDAPHCSLVTSPNDDLACTSSRVASEVRLTQIVQPKLIPPPPISWYIRGITTKQVEFMLEYLGAEAKRLRQGDSEEQQVDREQNGLASKHRQMEHAREVNVGKGSRSRFKRWRKDSWRVQTSPLPDNNSNVCS